MKLSVIQMLGAIVLSGAVGVAYADEGMNQKREEKEADILTRKAGSVRASGTMTTGKMMIVALTSMSMAILILIFRRDTIHLRANAASGTPIVHPASASSR